MSIRGWFAKKMLSAMREEQEKEAQTTAMHPRHVSDMERMFGSVAPAIVAFKISNGYVVRTISEQEMYEGQRNTSGFTYCKDHQEIADHIITHEAKRKLGVQGELFPNTVGQQLQNKLGRAIPAQRQI